MNVRNIANYFKRQIVVNTDQATPLFFVLGLVIAISFSSFFLINKFFLVPNGYESPHLRMIIITLGIALSLHKFWPEKIAKHTAIIFHFIIFLSFPFFFTFMLFHNSQSSVWHINGLIGFMLLAFFVDFVFFVIMTFLAILICYLITKDITLSPIIYSVLSSYSSPITYFIIFSQKKKSYYEEIDKKIKERTADLEKALSANSYFLGNISHEIRAPIQGFTFIVEGLFQNWGDFSEKYRYQLVKNIVKNSQKLSLIVNNILDLSKVSSSTMIFSFSHHNFICLVEEIIEEARCLYLYNKKITISFVKPKKSCLSYIDRDRMSQVIRNLLINAIKFTPPKSVILISLKYSEKEVLFNISDEGPGIDEEDIENIFIPFYQGDKKFSHGTGLGLAISKKIIEAHNGKIWALNNPDHGSTFSFSLPLNNALERK